jgi:DNA-binding NarL/FixJ family response regulator
MIQIAIIDEIESKQLELKNFLNAQPEWTCTYIGDSVAAWERAFTYGKLDILIISLNKIAASGLLPYQLRKVKQAHPETELLVLADCSDIKIIFSLLKMGVVGYLPRQTPMLQLKEAIIGIHQGGAYIVPLMIRQMLNTLQSPENFGELLTEREKEIVQCLVQCMSYKLMALELQVTLDTVRYHLRNLYRKLKVNSNSQVISRAISMDWKA